MGGNGGSPSTAGTAPEAATPAINSPTTPEPATPAETPPAAPDAELLALADATNIASSGFPWRGRFAGVVERWTLPIPVKTNGEPRAVPAMDAIEAKLGYVVFDQTSIATADRATITRGIVFRQGTSYLPASANPQSYCANVVRAPFEGGYIAPTSEDAKALQ